MKKFITMICMLAVCAFVFAQPSNNKVQNQKLNDFDGLGTCVFNDNHTNSTNSRKIAKDRTIEGQDWWEPDTIILFKPDDSNVRFIYKYNSKGLNTYEIYQIWENNTWINGGQTVFIYDEKYNLLSEVRQDWKNDFWLNKLQYIFTYDANNNMLHYLFQFWGDDNWLNHIQYFYTYDDNNNKISMLEQKWRLIPVEEWGNGDKITYTYDDRNNLLTEFEQRWSIKNNDFENRSFRTYTYDDNNNKISEIYKDWHIFPKEEWRLIYQNVYTYDENKNKISELNQSWHYLNEEWFNNTQTLYTYNGSNYLLSEIKQKLQNTWTITYQNINTYDENNNLLIEFYHNSETGNTWQSFFTYDDNNNRLSEIFQRFIDSLWVNDLKFEWSYDENHNCILTENWKWENENWQSAPWFFTFYYNNMQSNISFAHTLNATASYINIKNIVKTTDLEPVTISIYPNPTTGDFWISQIESRISQIEILDVLGRTVRNLCISTDSNSNVVKIDISDLSTGVFFLKVYTDNGRIHIQKLIKHQ